MIVRIVLALVVLAALALAALWILGQGFLATPVGPGVPSGVRIPQAVVGERAQAQTKAARTLGVGDAKQILFGDLHVHSTYSFDAFAMSMPLTGGDGAHPVSDACDFARHCAALDFWSINDHALALTPKRWEETVGALRQCNLVSGDPANPDTVAYLGWEWTQVGARPETHYGHKNVILRDLEDGRIPTRPIASVPPVPASQLTPNPLLLGLFAATEPTRGGREFARYTKDLSGVPICPDGVPVRDLPDDCREQANTPQHLFAKLDDWGHESLVIPHGTTWGFYTPPGSSWDKQLTAEQHDPERQRLVEIFSGHGNSEEYRGFREVVFAADGSATCPAPTSDYTPSCWQAGEIIRRRCNDDGESDAECESRAQEARRVFLAANRNGGAWTVPGATVQDWLEAGQCRDCFQPSFNYRPKNSVQYMMALSRPQPQGDPLRFRFGFMASSDNHSARPGTGYKEVARTEFTEARFGYFPRTPLGRAGSRSPDARSEAYDMSQSTPIFGVWESERQASFFLNGGLVAVHSEGRSREQVFDAMKRKEVYGTSGPRILLWFDLLNPPGAGRVAMGGEARLSEAPFFEVRAVGSFEQKPGCPDHTTGALDGPRLARLCQDECYHPSDQRRRISRIEIVRIRPQQNADEPVADLIEDPWKTFPCAGNPGGCRVMFSDPEFAGAGRDALYYARAVEEKSLAVNADPLRCERDAEGRCLRVRPCFDEPVEDDCLSETEERAWSSPIFVDYAR